MSGKKNPIKRLQRPVKKLLDDVSLSKQSPVVELQTPTAVNNNGRINSLEHGITASSSTLKCFEEIRKDQTTSSDRHLLQPTTVSMTKTLSSNLSVETPNRPASATSPFFYSPMYRRYFGLTPPNPRLYNPRLLEDYIDWYINVYLEEELPWSWIDVVDPQERRARDEAEAKEEAETLDRSPSFRSKEDEQKI